jgi:WD40 repeat protein
MLVLHGHTATVRTLAFAPAGRVLASGGDDLSVRLWDPATGAELACCWHGGHVCSVAFAHGGDVVVSAGMTVSVKLWQVPAGKKFGHDFRSGNDDISLPISVAVAPDGDLLALCRQGMVRLGRVSAGHRSTSATTGAQEHLPAFSPDGNTLAVVNSRGQVRLWDLAAAAERVVLDGPGVVCALAFSPDGKLLATGERDGSVALWDLAHRTRSPLPAGHSAAISSVAFSPDSRTLVSAGRDGVVRTWDVAAGLERSALDWQLGKVHAVAFAPDGMTIAAAGDSPDIVIWDVEE